MNFEAMPIIRLEIERLNHAVQSMLGASGSELGDAIGHQIDKAVSEYDLEGEVKRIVNKSITESIEHYMLHGAAKDAINNMVATAFADIGK